MRLKDKSAIVTGGGFGMGRAICLAYAHEGARVTVADINENNAQSVADEINEHGGQAIASKTDVRNAADIATTVERCLERFDRIDILVNNVGVRCVKSFLDHTEDDWRDMLDVNLTSQFLCAKAVIPHMLKQGKGKIINFASIASYIGRPNRVAYCAAKGGVLQFTRALATDMKGRNIFVNAIVPGSIATGMNAEPAADPNMDWGSETLLERWGQPEDIAGAAIFLASDESDYITGADLRIDGGWLAGRARDGEL